jgi:hypothetical protein
VVPFKRKGKNVNTAPGTARDGGQDICDKRCAELLNLFIALAILLVGSILPVAALLYPFVEMPSRKISADENADRKILPNKATAKIMG